MRCLSVLSSVLLACTAVASPFVEEFNSDSVEDAKSLNPLDRRFTTACTTGVHVMVVRGNSHTPPHPYGALTSTVNGIEKAVPGSNDFDVQYPRGPNAKHANAPSTNDIGRQHLQDRIEQYAQTCPKSPIVILSYSRGGIIVMNLLCGGQANLGVKNPPLDTKYLANIIAVPIYGEESRTANEPYNRGTCVTGVGKFPRKNTTACLNWKSVIRSWADKEDPLCCRPKTNPNGYIHTHYQDEYNGAVFSFVKKQYAKYQSQMAAKMAMAART